MNIKSFLKLVEIQTKLASMIPFATGTLFVLHHFKFFNITNFLLMFSSLFIFDMTTTAINNFYDYKRAKLKEGYNYEEHNAIGRDGLSLTTVKVTIIIMFIVAVTFGIALTLNTDFLVLAIGILSFSIGIIYSFGPVPLNATPFGEAVSGFFMGFIIIFLSIYIHLTDEGLFLVSFTKGVLDFKIDILWLLKIFILSIPHMICIANIMLANNICDMEEDIKNNRYTLPNFIGKEKSLLLYELLYIIAFISIVFGVIIKALPFISLLGIIAVIPIYKNIKLFKKVQTKKDTFGLTVKNYFLLSISQLAIFGIEVIIK